MGGQLSEDREEWVGKFGRTVTDVGGSEKAGGTTRKQERKEEMEGRRREVTVEMILRDRGTEVLMDLLQELIYKATHWFAKRYKGMSRAPASWRILRLVILKSGQRIPSHCPGVSHGKLVLLEQRANACRDWRPAAAASLGVAGGQGGHGGGRQ